MVNQHCFYIEGVRHISLELTEAPNVYEDTKATNDGLDNERVYAREPELADKPVSVPIAGS